MYLSKSSTKHVSKFQQEEMEAAQVAAEGPQTFTEKLYNFFREIILLVETPEMRKRTLNVFYSWLVVAMVYYGLSFNTKKNETFSWKNNMLRIA